MLLRLIALALLLCPLPLAAEEINAGFVRGFWYSTETVFADTPTRVYVAIRNNTGGDLTGTVTFYANDKKIGTQPVAALNNRLIESWIDWEPAYGEYELRAELTRVKVAVVGEATETVDSALAAATDTIFVDYDTDRDGEGNKTDADDDDDGTSDTEEEKNGTDPLKGVLTTVARAEAGEEIASSDTVPTPATLESTGGLERYLTPSRADALLSGVTAWATSAKTKLDDYRNERARGNAEAKPVTVNSDGFGEVTRSTDPDAIPAEAPTPNSFVGDLVRFIGALLSGLMSLVLALLSWVLGHALFLQLLILFGILGGTYFLAKKMGGRPVVVKKKK